MIRVRFGHRKWLWGSRGSAVMIVLLSCLALAVVLQTTFAVIVCADRAIAEEKQGRSSAAERNKALSSLAVRCATSWQATTTDIWIGSCTGAVTALAQPSDWVVGATVRQSLSGGTLADRAWIERGRDGVDLPLAGVVADELTAAAGRTTCWVDREDESATADGGRDTSAPVCYLSRAPGSVGILGEGCAVANLDAKWRFSDGWPGTGEEKAKSRLAWTEAVRVVRQDFGTVLAPDDLGQYGKVAGEPCLVILTGGANLDARNLGEFYGVIVVDQGSVQLDGTVVHGAVFASETVSLGESGEIKFSPAVLRWATDRSLRRTRLVPGTHSQGME